MSGVERADIVLAAAAARHPGILVPGRATSPMDACPTVGICAQLIAECEPNPHTELLDREMRQAAAGITPRPATRRLA